MKAPDDRLALRSVLLVEPYLELRDVLYKLLARANCHVDFAMTEHEMQLAIAENLYDCVLINIDQNWAIDYGMELATKASASGARIIMIPDHTIDVATITAKGWLHLTKPFTVSDVLTVLGHAIGTGGTTLSIQQRKDRDAQRRSRT